MANFVGAPANDTLLGSVGNDALTGLAGNDTVSGGLGNDMLLGSDSKSFYALFPDALDAGNRIKANQTLPRPEWRLGPVGTDQLLVSDTSRDRTVLPPDSAAPFTFSLNDLPGRAALIDFFAGQGVSGESESFGAKLLSIKEVR
jgi:Ca2+-binding RTX toxin-like protein